MATPYTPTPRLRPSVILPDDGDPVDEATSIAPMQHTLDIASIAQASHAKNYRMAKIKASGPWLEASVAGLADGKRAWVVCGGDSDSTDTFVSFTRDGQSWAEQANPRNTQLRCGAYSPALNMWALAGNAIGGDAYIITSPNGRAPWTERSNPADLQLNGMCAGPLGEFVGVGESGYILRSLDGITWGQQVPPLLGPLNGVHYAAGLFVAFGAALLTSVDGINWVQRATPYLGHTGCGVAYNGRYWVALTLGGEILRSQYGISWTQVRASGIDISGWTRGIAADLDTGIFVAAGDATTGVLVSVDDGLTWDSATILGGNDGVTSVQPMSVVWGHGRFFIGCQGGMAALGNIR